MYKLEFGMRFEAGLVLGWLRTYIHASASQVLGLLFCTTSPSVCLSVCLSVTTYPHMRVRAHAPKHTQY